MGKYRAIQVDAQCPIWGDFLPLFFAIAYLKLRNRLIVNTFHEEIVMIINPRLFENLNYFFVECLATMMLFLILNVSLHYRNHRFTIGKSCIAALPSKPTLEIIVVQPFGGLAFERLDKVADGF